MISELNFGMLQSSELCCSPIRFIPTHRLVLSSHLPILVRLLQSAHLPSPSHYWSPKALWAVGSIQQPCTHRATGILWCDQKYCCWAQCNRPPNIQSSSKLIIPFVWITLLLVVFPQSLIHASTCLPRMFWVMVWKCSRLSGIIYLKLAWIIVRQAFV